MNKKITLDQIKQIAVANNIPSAALRAVMQVECGSSGFNADGTPVILFERHVFRRQLISHGKSVIAKKAMKERPDLCNTSSGGYGPTSIQNSRLAAASKYDRTSALEACSWGIGQVMGCNWQALGYESLQEFINAMNQDEGSQLDAMIRFIKYRKLDKYLRVLDWASFAKGYNGENYKANQYDTKLSQAYKSLTK